MYETVFTILLSLAVVGQIGTTLIYPYMRRKVLKWEQDLDNLNSLNRSIALTYGWYIQGMNLAFGLLTLFYMEELIHPEGLAFGLLALITLYWICRVILQFSLYDFSKVKSNRFFRFGVHGITFLIIALSLTYGSLFTISLIHMI